jgi:CDP-glucose 4,6-dehydratase
MGILMLDFFNGRKVLITGHTGFKGAWLSRILVKAGAEVTGYALQPPTNPSLFGIGRIHEAMNSVIGDIRDLGHLEKVLRASKPEIVFHLAAQPLVRYSYTNPLDTYEINVMGTVCLLECVRRTDFVRSLLNVTTDKVYQNNEWAWGYRETDPLDGFDPYSNSKSCSELVTHSYRNSFLQARNIAVSTARAGNVIGGGDYAMDRIIPDCIRAAEKQETIKVRNPNSIRPYQHVLDPLRAYLEIASKQYDHPELADCYNVGPDNADCVTTGQLVDVFCKKWTALTGYGQDWQSTGDNGPHEAGFLKLDSSKIRSMLGWQARWHIDEALEKTVEWTRDIMNGENATAVMDRQIAEFWRNN